MNESPAPTLSYDRDAAPPTPPADEPAPSMRRDVLSAYLATGARSVAWVIAYGLVRRTLGDAAFAMLALVRVTIGILNNTSLGLAPAMIHLLAKSDKRSNNSPAPASLYANGAAIALASTAAGAALVAAYAAFLPHLQKLPAGLDTPAARALVLFLGLGTVLRFASDAPGAVLQTRHRIALDNLFLASTELLWILSTALLFAATRAGLGTVGVTYLVAAAALCLARFTTAEKLVPLIPPRHSSIQWPILRQLLSFGLLVTFAQLADFLYSWADYQLIDHLKELNPLDVAVFAPAAEIDGGLLLLVMGLASVLLPKAALAHAAGDTRAVRRYYVRGTLASLALLLAASTAVVLLAPYIFQLWFKDPLPRTQAILPLLLVSTVVGGSSMVGRSILLAVGRVRPFTASVLIAGLANVLLCYSFVKYLHLGLKGIVLGTMLAVVSRCALWMPWYVLRTLRQLERSPIPPPQTTPS